MTVRTRPLALAALAAAALLGTAVPAVVAPAPLAFADEVDDEVAALREAVKANDDKAATAKITALEGKLDGRVTDAMADIARTAKSDQVAKLAMKIAAQRKDDGLFKWLKGKIDDKKMAEDHEERYLGVLDSLAFYGDKSTLKALEDVVKKYLPTNSNISKRAIAAYGSVRQPSVVDQLIKWLQETENTRGQSQSGKNMSAQTRENYGEAGKEVLKTLGRLTLQDMADAPSWEKWWKENAKGFEFPDPNAPEVDFATLSDFVDKAYGFTLKKPGGDAFWQFAKCELSGGRVTLQYRDDKNVLWARMNVMVWKGNGEISSPETFAAYYDKTWREAEFEQFSKEPETVARKIGGREFQVVTARGMGKDSWKNWEGCERRIYITRANPSLFLYFECAVRSGAEDPVKNAFWGCVEGITFKGGK